MHITEEKLAEIENALRKKLSLALALRASDLEPTIETLTYLQKNHYDRLTDAKFGKGHAEHQRELREQFKGG